ncbi:hypothetical protein EJ04DRAFT_573409 [Polyplosphaeria fusca]|uniref:Uncharacterized protein n=1 Tax=Polyplosphaeria fusca TaxID=682080 RepID=A0A9P4R8W7_9PLEO|nr:hypothetical protein EJ04DRAFT_573409 [Polyplosphaeria fusca]
MKIQLSMSLAIGATILLAASTSSQVPISPPCDYKWFEQSIDHFGTRNGTFQQRFSISTQYFKPGGPILYFVGEETTFLDCVNDTVLPSFAEQLGGIAVSLEHRYFGESLPFGSRSQEVNNLRLLTLENVMADGVRFAEWLRESVPGAEKSRVILASGSYGAFLATAMRQSHPSTFFAAISSAAPVRGFIRADNTSNGHNPDYTLQQFFAASFEATMNIRNAFASMHDEIRSGNASAVREALNLCTTPTANESVLATIDNIYDTAISVLLEFDYAHTRPGRINVTNSFGRIIDFSLKSHEPLGILKYGLGLYFTENPLPCVNWTDTATIFKGITPVIQRETFGYIGCTYHPNAVGTMGHARIFAQNAILSYLPSLEACKKKYNVTPAREDEIWSRFKISPAHLANSTRIIFSNAEHDPISGQAPQAMPLSDDVCRSRVLWTSGMAHREDLFKPEAGDKVEVEKTRRKEVEILKSWLALCAGD